MSFKVSDKVVCVDDSDQDIGIPGDYVKSGTTYVVRSICSMGGLRLVGVFAGLWPNGEEVSFLPTRFRLLSEVKEENAMKAQSDDFMKFAGDHYSRVFKSLCKPDDNPDLP